VDIQRKIKELLEAGMLYGGNTPEEKLTWLIGELKTLSRVELPVKPAKNVKDYDWLNNKLDDILAQFEHRHITKEGAKDLLFEFIFEDLVNQIQELKDSSLSV